MSGALAVLVIPEGNPLFRNRSPRQQSGGIRTAASLSPSQTLFQINEEERAYVRKYDTLIGYGGRTIGREGLTLLANTSGSRLHRPVTLRDRASIDRDARLSPHRSRS